MLDSSNASSREPLFPLRVLIVEDDDDVARTMQLFLRRFGMDVRVAHSASEALVAKREHSPEIVLVDMELPDANGVDLIPRFARDRDCGIIIVSGAAAEAERVVGMELGADDYVVKPASMRELVARIRALHRRVSHSQSREQNLQPALDRTIAVGAVSVDLKRRIAFDRDGNPIDLTSAEFRLIELLAEARGKPVARDRLCSAALNRPLGFEDRAVDQLVVNIRRKLGDEGARRAISSVRGAGYALHA